MDRVANCRSDEAVIREVCASEPKVETVRFAQQALLRHHGIARDRKLRDRRGEVLFIDARKLGFMVDRTRKEFSDADISQIAETYHAWRLGEGYADVPGFCKSASLEEIRSHGYVLTPGRYVGAEAAEEDDTPFAERFIALQDKLEEQFAQADALTATIRERLAGVIGL